MRVFVLCWTATPVPDPPLRFSGLLPDGAVDPKWRMEPGNKVRKARGVEAKKSWEEWSVQKGPMLPEIQKAEGKPDSFSGQDVLTEGYSY